MTLKRNKLNNYLKKIKENKLDNDSIEELINYYYKTKDPKIKCDIAIILSHVKDNHKVIEPTIDSLKFWKKSDYKGYALTTPAKIIVNYNKAVVDRFEKLLDHRDKNIRFLVAGAWCFIIITEGVDHSKAQHIFNTQSKKILTYYLLKETDKKNVKFVLDFLIKNLSNVEDLVIYYQKIVKSNKQSGKDERERKKAKKLIEMIEK